MERDPRIAIVGATGAVGAALLRVLSARNFPFSDLQLLASPRSAGKTIDFAGRSYRVKDVAEVDFADIDMAFFSAGASVSAVHAVRAATAGCVVIDNTSQFRYQDDIPLVVPEVNAADLAGFRARNIIANPNCSTIQMVVALKPLHDAARITRINVVTYQAVSGTGQSAIEELRSQSAAVLSGDAVSCEVYPRQIAFNVLPHIDAFQENGYTREEMKMVWETRKILGDGDIQVNPTAARVPVFYGHSEAVHIETERKLTLQDAQELLAAAPGVVMLDKRADGGYPTAATEASGQDSVFVGRLREDISHPRGLNLWVVADNIRKGAATNSIQIGEILLKDYL